MIKRLIKSTLMLCLVISLVSISDVALGLDIQAKEKSGIVLTLLKRKSLAKVKSIAIRKLINKFINLFITT